MPGGDTITQGRVERSTLRQVIADGLLRAICARFGHRWRDAGHLAHGTREWCQRCESNRIVFPDGEVVMATAVALRACDPVFAEALYEARWGDKPRRRMRRGEWVAL